MRKFDDYSIEEVKKMIKNFNARKNCNTALFVFLGVTVTISVVILVILKLKELFCDHDDFDDDFYDDDYYDLDYDDTDDDLDLTGEAIDGDNEDNSIEI